MRWGLAGRVKGGAEGGGVGWGEECKPAQTYFGYELPLFIYSFIQSTLSDFKASSVSDKTEVEWVALNRVVWLEFYDWQCHGMEENNNKICPGDLVFEGVSYTKL